MKKPYEVIGDEQVKDKACPYCEQESEAYETYRRKIPVDREEEGEEIMVALYPCGHCFRKDIYTQYVEVLKEVEEYEDNFLTAKGDKEREKVDEEYEETMRDFKIMKEKCCEGMEFVGDVDG